MDPAEIAKCVRVPAKFAHLYSEDMLRETAERVAEKEREQVENPWIFKEYCRTILTLHQREASRGKPDCGVPAYAA